MQSPHRGSAAMRFLAALLLVACAWLTGCAQIKLGEPVASQENILKARASGAGVVALGPFELAPGKDIAMDQRVSVRSNNVFSPYDNSFAKYLRENLAVELRAAGMLAPTALVAIEAQLTDSQVDAGASAGVATVAARFRVVKQGQAVYDEELRARSSWESQFIGAVAIPAAINEYTRLYRKLIGMLLDDARFKAAVKK